MPCLVRARIALLKKVRTHLFSKQCRRQTETRHVHAKLHKEPYKAIKCKKPLRVAVSESVKCTYVDLGVEDVRVIISMMIMYKANVIKDHGRRRSRLPSALVHH